ncbi:hypothetical protein F383_17079 [Gossypium arboreum]|uniref:Uncharacterized protein n=1 Tax=Gossypium arboreum TaxID=29729 RepID=A0A0B0NTL5_GOSAR|nr:hypothetical protein F383_17079 [Gossypium arboreum]
MPCGKFYFKKAETHACVSARVMNFEHSVFQFLRCSDTRPNHTPMCTAMCHTRLRNTLVCLPALTK